MKIENDLLSLFEESDNKAISEIAIKEENDKEFMPIMYKIIKAGDSTRTPLDTYKVEQGRFEMAKGKAVKKAKMIGNCYVYEIVKRSEVVNGKISYRLTERLVIQTSEGISSSETILYKSGHSRRRARA
jgi:hypothetical protein